MTAILIANLELAMSERGWSMRELCRKADMNVSAVHDIISGRAQSPRLDTIERLAEALGVQVTDLLSERRRADAEKAILDAVSRLSEQDQKRLTAIAQALASQTTG